jgi:hypothetical protein
VIARAARHRESDAASRVTCQILDQAGLISALEILRRAHSTAAHEDLSARYISVSPIRARRNVEDAFAT